MWALRVRVGLYKKMGSSQSGFRPNENTVSEYSSPSSADWITAHATATGCKDPPSE